MNPIVPCSSINCLSSEKNLTTPPPKKRKLRRSLSGFSSSDSLLSPKSLKFQEAVSTPLSQKKYKIVFSPVSERLKVALTPSCYRKKLRGVVYEIVRKKVSADDSTVIEAGISPRKKVYTGYTTRKLGSRISDHISKANLGSKTTEADKGEFSTSRTLYRELASCAKNCPEDVEKRFYVTSVYDQVDSSPKVEPVERKRYVRNIERGVASYNAVKPAGSGPLSKKEWFNRISENEGKGPSHWSTEDSPFFPKPDRETEGACYHPRVYWKVVKAEDGSLKVTLPPRVASFRGDLIYVFKHRLGCLVGVTDDLMRRLPNYLNKCNEKFRKAVLDKGCDFGVVGTVKELGFGYDRWEAEKEYVKFFDSVENGFNCNGGGNAGSAPWTTKKIAFNRDEPVTITLYKHRAIPAEESAESVSLVT